MKDVFDRIAEELVKVGTRPAERRPSPVKRARVTRSAPLTFELMDGSGIVLDEKDEDVEISSSVDLSGPAKTTVTAFGTWEAKRDGPKVGDVLILHQDEHDDWLVTGVLKRSG